MINCAAIFGPTNRRLTDVSTAEFDFETAINLRGTVLIAKHAIVARGRGDEGTRGRGTVRDNLTDESSLPCSSCMVPRLSLFMVRGATREVAYRNRGAWCG